MKIMNRMQFNKQNRKKILLGLISLILLLAASVLVTTEIIISQPDSVQQTIAEKFNQMKNQLEFKGLAASVKDVTEDYSKLFDGYSNIIITDDNGKILYNLNSGYITEKDRFSILVDPWKANGYGSNIAYLIDSRNNIKYTAQLDIAQNTNKLRDASSRNPLAEMLYSKTQEAFDSAADKQITNSDGTTSIISADSNIIMNYEYIASKGFNLYSLYDSEHQYNNYYLFANTMGVLRHWLIIAGLVVLLIFLVFVSGIFLRSGKKKFKCRACKRDLENGWQLCPYCGEKIDHED